VAATTKSTSARSSNGTAAKAKDAGGAVTAAVRTAKAPALAASAAVVGLAGGIALGSHLDTRRRGLSGLVGRAARELGSATRRVSATTDEIRQVREQLEQANRQSPVEVLLNGLTHRRGANKRES
jgi:hypothetical protein